MPRLSLWKNGRHSADYKFMDRRISEMFTIGGTGILLHKYLGPNTSGIHVSTTAGQTAPGKVLTIANTAAINIGDAVYGDGISPNTVVTAKDALSITVSKNTTRALGIGVNIGISTDATKPAYTNQSAQNIQDLLLMENRDRKYDTSVYKIRGVYQVADQDFDLSQFGLFLATGTLFMTFHYNDMTDTIGRKIMAGDVLELEHLADYDPLNADIPAALKRFFVVGDCSFASEGYSPTWWPHLWRVKLNPLVDSQEYKDILNNITAGNTNLSIGQILSTYDSTIAVNNAIIQQAEADVPQSGYDVSNLFVFPTQADGYGVTSGSNTADNMAIDASDVNDTADEMLLTPTHSVPGYLSGDGLAPDGYPVSADIQFPSEPKTGDYCLRTDYLPNRLFRFNGAIWVKVEDVQRTSLTLGANNKTLRNSFVYNPNQYTVADIAGNPVTRNEKQSLSQALRPKADNA